MIKNIFDTSVQAVLTATVTYKMPYNDYLKDFIS
jgi:hypothetical protein